MTATYADPAFLPAPTRLDPAPGAFDIDAATSITMGADASDDTLFAARLVQTAVRDATGLEVPLRKERAPMAGVNRIALVLRGRDEATGLVSVGQESGAAEGYHLASAPGHVWLVGASEAGLFYAAQTLRQVLQTRGRRLPGLAIDDRPALASHTFRAPLKGVCHPELAKDPRLRPSHEKLDRSFVVPPQDDTSPVTGTGTFGIHNGLRSVRPD